MNVFIGCGSEIVDDKFYKNSLSLVAKLAAIEDINLVFGAYHNGLMGSCYDIFKNHNKKVCGVTLKIYKDRLDDLDLDETIIVETSMDRMREIYQKSDVLLFLPGGLGTYTEILSSIEESRTKEDNKLISGIIITLCEAEKDLWGDKSKFYVDLIISDVLGTFISDRY